MNEKQRGIVHNWRGACPTDQTNPMRQGAESESVWSKGQSLKPRVRCLLEKGFRILIACCVFVIAALLVVGAVSHGIIRHIVQTSPLWIAIVPGIRRSAWSKWAALPCFVFWFLLMTAIWLYLLGWARLISGTFSPTEIAMTVIVGLACLAGLVTALRIRSDVGMLSATGIVLLVAVLQVAVLRLSFLPAIAHR